MGLVHPGGRQPPPKSRDAPSVAEEIFQRFGALEADFLSHYRIDLGLDALESMTWRRFMVLLEGLPAEGAFWRSVYSPRAEKQATDSIRAKHREALRLGPPPTFRHRSQ